MIRNRMKSVIFYSVQMIVMSLIMGYIIYTCAFRILVANLEESLIELAKQGATAVEVYLDSHLREMRAVSLNSIISDSSLPYAVRLQELEKQLALDTFKRLGIADLKGNAVTTDGNQVYIGDREYFLKAVAGISNASDPLISRTDGTMVIIFAVPIYEKGSITGVLYGAHDGGVLSMITDKIRLGPNGSSFIINKFGNTIAHDNRQLVYAQDNILEKEKNSPGLKKLEELERQMIAGLTGAGEYTYEGIIKYMGYSPIANTDWSIAVSAPKNQVFEKINQVLGVILISVFFTSIIITIISIYSGSLKRRLYQEQKISNQAFDLASILVLSLDREGRILDYNRFGEKFLSIISQKKKGEYINLFDLLTGEEGIKLKNILSEEKLDQNFELSFHHGLNEPVHILCTVNKDPVYDKDAGQGLVLIGVDITERVISQNMLQASYEKTTAAIEELAATEEELRKRYEELVITQQKLLESEERYQLALEGSNDAIWDWNYKEKKIYYSNKFYEVTGYSRDEFNGYIFDLYHPDDRELAIAAHNAYMEEFTSLIQYQARIKTKNQGYKWILVKGKGIIDNQGNLTRLSGSITDINEARIREDMIRQLAYYDNLTGLPNRVFAYQEIASSVFRATINNYQGALAFIDLNNFKYINDSCGHLVGDMLLKAVGKRLTDHVNDAGIVSRLGGDEFIILIKNLQAAKQIGIDFDTIMDCFNRTFSVEGNCFNISASCGITIFPDDGKEVDMLLKNADMAMYQAKKNKKHTYVMFNQIKEEVNLERSLRKALENNEFVLYYQPLFDLNSGEIIGFEALIRWQSPTYGFVYPPKFIGIAEESGFIVPIGKWVLKTACLFIKFLHDQGYQKLMVSVNVSVAQLMESDFVETVLNILHDVAIEPCFLELELTESILMETLDVNYKKLKRLLDSGVTIAIDDFGKGYSSLSYLKSLPVNKLKIDKSFIDGIGSQGDFTESIVEIGHKIGLGVVAEGVETKGQLDFLARTKCNYAQGYWLGMPVTAEEALDLLKKTQGNKISRNMIH